MEPITGIGKRLAALVARRACALPPHIGRSHPPLRPVRAQTPQTELATGWLFTARDNPIAGRSFAQHVSARSKPRCQLQWSPARRRSPARRLRAPPLLATTRGRASVPAARRPPWCARSYGTNKANPVVYAAIVFNKIPASYPPL